MRIQHNIPSMNAYRNYNNNAGALNRNLEKLSSGYRINRAGDDAAGLAISEKMRAQITGLDAATKNVKDGISLVKTAEGAMQEVHDMLGRMKYLATQSSNGTYQDDVDRENIQKEVNSLLDEINRIADSANFNGQKLLNGELDSVTRETGFTLPGVGDILGTDTRLNTPGNTKTNGTKFTVDFGTVKIAKKTATGNAVAADSMTINIGDIKIDLAIDTSASRTWTDDVNLGKILQDIFALSTTGSSVSSSGITATISGAVYNTNTAGGLKSAWYLGTSAEAGKDFTATGTGNKITFEQGGAPDKAAGLIDGDMTVKVTGGSAGFAVDPKMTYNTKTVDVYNAKVKSVNQVASTTLTLTEDMVKVGNGIKIGNQTYTFVEGNAGTNANQVQVDDLLKKYEQDNDKDQFLRNVTDRLSVAANANTVWSVSTSVKGKPGEIMLTEQTGATAAGFNFSKLQNIQDSVGLVSQGTGLNLQIGDTSDKYNQMKVGVTDMHAKTLGIAGLDVSTADAAHDSIDKIQKAINSVSSTRGDLGAIQNRLEHTSNNLSVMKENIQDAESTIRDTDVADEMMKYTKNNILLQSAQAMLAQANQLPQGVLQLLQ